MVLTGFSPVGGDDDDSMGDDDDDTVGDDDDDDVANGCSPDAYEENDEFWLAAPIAANLYTALTICSGDDDFYSITLSVQSLLEVDLTFFQVEGDIDLIVKNAVGALVGSSNSPPRTTRASASPACRRGAIRPPGAALAACLSCFSASLFSGLDLWFSRWRSHRVRSQEPAVE
jgi:hypothetical protein